MGAVLSSVIGGLMSGTTIAAGAGVGLAAGAAKKLLSRKSGDVPGPSPTKTGLTDSAQSEQDSASGRMNRQRKAFSTVVAGETGNSGTSDKLGITGRI